MIDSTTIRLFSDLLKGVGRNPKGDGKKKGGLKVHMLIDAVQSVGRFIKIGLKGSLCSFFPILDKDEFVLVERKTGKIREIKINRQLKHS